MEEDYQDGSEIFDDFAVEETQHEDLELLLVTMRDKYNEREAIRKEEKRVSAEYEALNRNAVRLYNTRGIKSQKLAGIGSFFIRATVMPTVKNMGRLVDWLDTNGDGDLAPRTVHPSRLKSYVNERIEKGLTIPDTEIMETFTKETVAIRRQK